MPRQQIIMREIARRSGISAKKQKHGNVSSLEMDAIVKAGAEMKRLKWLDIDCRQMTLEQFDERVNRLQGEHGVEHYVVDHIGKFAWNGRLDGLKDFEKANRATSTLKNICMRRGVAIIALTHINKNTGAAVASKNFADRLSFAKFSRPRYKDFLGNIDKDADHMIITHQTRPAITALEPEEGTPNYSLWEAAMEEATGKAEFILALSRENEFPRRSQVQWNGSTTSYGPDFSSQWNEKGLF
jgi:replicative DNA helicase